MTMTLLDVIYGLVGT